MSDPISRLLEAIAAREKRANDCLTDGSRWWDWQQLRAKGSWFTVADAVHIALHDPSSVLRRCKEDREMVRKCSMAEAYPHLVPPKFAEQILRHLAAGYGITEEEK